MTTSQVSCPCGALYERTEFNAAPRENDRFVCAVCGETLELFTEIKAPTYRLISGPLRMPDALS
jgi:transposase-like protein